MRKIISMKMINYWPMLNNNIMASISSREPFTNLNVRMYYIYYSFNLAMLYDAKFASTSLFYFRLGRSMFL